MSWQRYTGMVQLERLRLGLCPDCGYAPSRHDGRGGPDGCGLTDMGVAGRIWQYQQDWQASMDDVPEPCDPCAAVGATCGLTVGEQHCDGPAGDTSRK